MVMKSFFLLGYDIYNIQENFKSIGKMLFDSKLPSLVTPTDSAIQVTVAATLLALKLIFFTAATAH